MIIRNIKNNNNNKANKLLKLKLKLKNIKKLNQNISKGYNSS